MGGIKKEMIRYPVFKQKCLYGYGYGYGYGRPFIRTVRKHVMVRWNIWAMEQNLRYVVRRLKNYRYRKDLRARGEDAVCDIAAAMGSRRRPPRMGVDEQYTQMYTGGRLDRSRPTHLVCSQ